MAGHLYALASTYSHLTASHSALGIIHNREVSGYFALISAQNGAIQAQTGVIRNDSSVDKNQSSLI